MHRVFWSSDLNKNGSLSGSTVCDRCLCFLLYFFYKIIKKLFKLFISFSLHLGVILWCGFEKERVRGGVWGGVYQCGEGTVIAVLVAHSCKDKLLLGELSSNRPRGSIAQWLGCWLCHGGGELEDKMVVVVRLHDPIFQEKGNFLNRPLYSLETVLLSIMGKL